MTNSEKVKLMSGSIEDKKQLFSYLLEKVSTVGIDNDDVPMFEFLKNELSKKPQIVQMSANLLGESGIV